MDGGSEGITGGGGAPVSQRPPSVQILAIGEGPYVSHCLLGGDIKAEIPCTPKSLNSLQLNTNSTEHRVSQ